MTAKKPAMKQATKAARRTPAPTPPRWRKSTPELVAIFDAALPDDPRVERRQMFGYPCAFASGQLFAGLHQDGLMVRLGEVDRAKLLAIAGAHPFEPMQGRPMREYVVVPPALYGARSALRRWIGCALEYAASLPPKPRRVGENGSDR